MLTYFPIHDFSFQVRFALMPYQLMLEVSVSNQIYDDQGNPLQIQSSGLLSRAAFHRDLNRRYRRQLTEFPEEVIHSTTTMQRYLMPSPTTPRDNNRY